MLDRHLHPELNLLTSVCSCWINPASSQMVYIKWDLPACWHCPFWRWAGGACRLFLQQVNNTRRRRTRADIRFRAGAVWLILTALSKMCRDGGWLLFAFYRRKQQACLAALAAKEIRLMVLPDKSNRKALKRSHYRCWDVYPLHGLCGGALETMGVSG